MEGVTFYFNWEVVFMMGFQRFMESLGSWMTDVASFFTYFGEELILVAVMGFFYFCYNKEIGKKVAVTVCAGLVFNPMVKSIAMRRRPYFDNPGIKCLKPFDSNADIYDISAQGYSFPSGHSMNSVIIFGSIPVYVKKTVATLLPVIVLPLLVGLSRVMLGMHYPTDVFTGWIAGLVLLLVMKALQDRVPRRILHPIMFVIACIGLFYCRTTDYFTALGLLGGVFLAIPFEERFVKFEDTKSLLFRELRLVGGFLVYFAVNTLLKLPFSSDFLASPTMPAFMVRAVRYCIVAFVTLGVYPMLFRYVEKKRK